MPHPTLLERTRSAPRVALVALAAAAAGCGSARENPYAASASGYALVADRAVVVVDEGAKRAVALVPNADGSLVRRTVALRSPVVASTTSADGARTFLLTRGLEKTRTQAAVTAELVVVAVSGTALEERRYEVPEGMSALTLDPEGAYVAITASGGSGGLVVNPNAVALVNLSAAPSAKNPVVKSLARSPSVAQPLVFSPSLVTPRGAKRFLVAIGPREAALVDLAAAFGDTEQPNTTVPLTSAGATSALVPGVVRFDDGDPAANDDARVAFALARESSILTATLAANDAPLAGESNLRTVVNLTNVGAPVSDFAFLVTPEGRRIAALTPSRQRAVLADPSTSLTTPVPLARAYDGLRVLPGATASTILLTQTNGTTGAVALWDVPMTADQPYRAVEPVVDVGGLRAVEPIPGAASRFLVTSANGAQIAVLDAATRSTTAVNVDGPSQVILARDGARAYIVPSNGSVSFAALNLTTLTARKFDGGGARALVGEVRRPDGTPLVAVVHGSPATGLSIFDPARPDDLGKRWDDLLVEGVRP